MTEIMEFLETSPIAQAIRLPGCVILKRTRMSPAELLGVKTKGIFEAGVVETTTCELEVGGQVVASGRILRRGRKSYLEITRVLFEEVRTKEERDE